MQRPASAALAESRERLKRQERQEVMARRVAAMRTRWQTSDEEFIASLRATDELMSRCTEKAMRDWHEARRTPAPVPRPVFQRPASSALFARKLSPNFFASLPPRPGSAIALPVTRRSVDDLTPAYLATESKNTPSAPSAAMPFPSSTPSDIPSGSEASPARPPPTDHAPAAPLKRVTSAQLRAKINALQFQESQAAASGVTRLVVENALARAAKEGHPQEQLKHANARELVLLDRCLDHIESALGKHEELLASSDRDSECLWRSVANQSRARQIYAQRPQGPL